MNPRLQKLRILLKKNNLDAVLISSVPNIIFLTGFSDFTTNDRDAYLLITDSKQYIFTHGIYKEAVERKVIDFDLIPIQRENPISKSLKNIINQYNLKKVGFEAFDLRVNEYEKLIKTVDKSIFTATDLIYQLRTIKTKNEIQAIKKACSLGDKTYNQILEMTRTGISEKGLAFEIEFFIKKNGADISFPPIVAFGSHASKPHHVPTNTKLKQNSLILLDFGVKLDNYCSDMTRTVFFGKATKKQKEVYNIVLTAQQKALNYLKSSILNPKSQTSAKEADRIARDYIVSEGYPQMPHSLGHGIGHEVHEAPRLTPVSDEHLENGMVFSVEPGIYLPGKYGVRIEDLYAITDNKLIRLTRASSKFTELPLS